MKQTSSPHHDLVAKIVSASGVLSNEGIPAVIFDIDGTLVDVSSIQHLVSSGHRQFDAFHRESINCPPFSQVLEIAQSLLKGPIKVLAISGRQERYRTLTDYWLAMHSLPLHELVLRPNDYQGNRVQFKKEKYAGVASKYNILAVFDNDPELLSLWLTTQIPMVVQCPELILLERN